MQLAKIERATNPTPTVAVLLPTAARSSPSHTRGGGALPHEVGTSSSASQRPTRGLRDGVSVAEADDLRRRHRNAALYSATDIVATATEVSRVFLPAVRASALSCTSDFLLCVRVPSGLRFAAFLGPDCCCTLGGPAYYHTRASCRNPAALGPNVLGRALPNVTNFTSSHSRFPLVTHIPWTDVKRRWAHNEPQ